MMEVNPIRVVCIFCYLDIVYIIGGNCHFSAAPKCTYEVISVSLSTGKVSEAEDVLHAVVGAGSASSLNRIVICGGEQASGMTNLCQLYSPHFNRFVFDILIFDMFIFNLKVERANILLIAALHSEIRFLLRILSSLRINIF